MHEALVKDVVVAAAVWRWWCCTVSWSYYGLSPTPPSMHETVVSLAFTTNDHLPSLILLGGKFETTSSEMNGELEKQQVVLLLDTERPGTGSAEHQYRAQCVACTRLLLGLGGFPNREHPTNLQWSYKLFSSRTPAKLLKRGTAHFQKLHSEVLAEFFKDYKLSLNSQATKPPPVPGKDVWARHVYSVLAAAVQDFVWDAPEIKTPVHPRPRQRKSRRKQKTNAHAPPSSPHGNMIFLFSEGPGDCGGGGGCGSQVPLAAQVLPQAMMEQLRLKKISVFWVQSSLGAVVKNMCEDFRGLDSMLRSTGGGVVSISTFLDPVCGVSSSAAEHTGLDQV